MRSLPLASALLSIALVAAYAQPPNLADLIAAHPRQPQLAPGQAMGEEVSFPSGSLTLRGFLYRPTGDGPFRAVLWNHGSEKLPGWQPELAAFYNARGFVFFIPHRRGHGRSPGDYMVERARGGQDQVRMLGAYNADVVAALDWLKRQPYVDAGRIVMSGVSYGGIETLLAAEKDLGVRGFIPFAPAAMSWANLELRRRLLDAVAHAKAPVFLLQARNDYSTGPVDVLGAAIGKKAAPNQAKLYPAFGTTNQQGHGAFACWDIGTQIWGPDVLDFIGRVLPR